MDVIKCALVGAIRHARWGDWMAGERFEQLHGRFEFHSVNAASAELVQALRAHERSPFDALLMLVTQDNLAWAERCLKGLADLRLGILLITRGVVATAIDNLLRLGAADFLSDQFDVEELTARLCRLLPAPRGPGAPTECGGRPAQPPSSHAALSRLVGAGPAFMRQLSRIPVMAGCDAGVLVLGETGTGKELFAQAIHYLSARASKPWVAVNCGALPADLVEDELFGHAKGAYTTAMAAREGLVREAEGGSLFLDDVDCLPLSAQAKLLRFLQESEYRLIGANAVRHADVRVIAASNQSLRGLVERGGFRADLYYRLNVLSLNLPALRDRVEDVVPLACHFARLASRRFAKRVDGIGADAQARLLAHDWPGNVRELRHVIERAVLLSEGESLCAADIEVDAAGGGDGAESFRDAKARVVDRFERSYLEGLLAANQGNVTRAACAAKKNRRALFELIRKHGIDPSRYRAAH